MGRRARQISPGDGGEYQNVSAPDGGDTGQQPVVAEAEDAPEPLTFRPRGLQSGLPAQPQLPPAPEQRFRLPRVPALHNPFEDAHPLTVTELNKLKPLLREALEASAKYADDAISNTNKRHARCDIWSGPYGLDEKDLDTLTEVMLQRATLNGAVAQVVRGMVSLYQELQILLILGPKLWESYNFYRGNGGFGI